MSNYLGIVSYLGASFHGFQRQKDERNVQSVIEEKLSTILNEEILIKGAGRTDAGVHALSQAFSFKPSKPIDNLDKFVYSMNRILPSDIVLKSLKEVDDAFDARHSAIGKVYLYRFSWGERNPIDNGRVYQIGRDNFDSSIFKAALSVFLGEHDFSNFTSKPVDKDDFIRTILSIETDIDENKKQGEVTFRANGFMTYQIRFMLGVAFEAALGRFDVDEVRAMLEARPRKVVLYKAPSEGLYLKEVIYK